MFVTPGEVAGFLGKDRSTAPWTGYLEKLENAEAFISGAIGGDLNERTVTERYKIPFDHDAEDSVLFRNGPVREVSALTIDGVDDDELDDLIVSPWSCKRPSGFQKDAVLVFTLVCGWNPNARGSASDRMPLRLRQALTYVAGELVLRPLNVQQEKIGDYFYSYTTGSTEAQFGLSERTLVMIQDWVKMRL